MQESAIKKTSIAVIFFTVLTAVALYMGQPGKFRARMAGDSSSESVAAFFDGAIIKWIIPNDPGGGYDEYARLIAPYFEKYSGAHVHLSNIPGSGGMRALSELFTSPADGLTIGLINGSGMVTSQIAGIGNPDYRIGDLSFLGRVADDTRVLTVSARSQYLSFADILNTDIPVKIGATGFGGSTYVDAVISRRVFALNMNIIHGFNNSSAVRHAMLRGDIDGAWSSFGSVVDELAAGQIRLMLQGGETRVAALPDVPTVFEFIENTADPALTRKLLNAWAVLHAVGRPVAAPAGLSATKLQFLQEAFRQAMNDPQFLDDAAKARRFINFASGEDVARLVKEALSTPVEIQQIFIESVRSELQ